MKLCIDCKYRKFVEYGRWTLEQNVCTHPDLPTAKTEIDLVTGNELTVRQPTNFCHHVRYDEDKCGALGKWWELNEEN